MPQAALNIEKVDKTNLFQPLRITEEKAKNSWFWTNRARFAVLNNVFVKRVCVAF